MDKKILEDWKWRVDDIREQLCFGNSPYYDEWSPLTKNLKTLSNLIDKRIKASGAGTTEQAKIRGCGNCNRKDCWFRENGGCKGFQPSGPSGSTKASVQVDLLVCWNDCDNLITKRQCELDKEKCPISAGLNGVYRKKHCKYIANGSICNNETCAPDCGYWVESLPSGSEGKEKR